MICPTCFDEKGLEIAVEFCEEEIVCPDCHCRYPVVGNIIIALPRRIDTSGMVQEITQFQKNNECESVWWMIAFVINKNISCY
mgnify:CR=1 FL=1